MSTIRATLARFWIPLTGLYLIIAGLAALTSVAVSPIIVGVVALLAVRALRQLR